MNTVSLRRAVLTFVVSQFGRPHGIAGRLACWVMAHRGSNRRRNRWVVSLLGVQPADQVLEVGFGPGLAIAELSGLVGDDGHVHGVDHSEVSLRRATRRNAAAIRAGRVTLSLASVDHLPRGSDGPFDAILAVNSLAFWPAPAQRLAELRARLRPGGRIAIASQPRCFGATRSTSTAAAERIEALLRAAGFAQIRTETLDLDPPAVCVIAVDAEPPSSVLPGGESDGT